MIESIISIVLTTNASMLLILFSPQTINLAFNICGQTSVGGLSIILLLKFHLKRMEQKLPNFKR